jgi:multidrug efflux pump subunit AcrB
MENENKNALDLDGKGKYFAPSSYSVENQITVLVLTAIIFFSGLMAYIQMPSEAFPEIITPEIYVGTPYPGNSPSDIEKLITRPLEKEINAISGVDEVISKSVEGYSTIDIKFNFDVTPEEALRKVKDKVDVAKTKPDFPTDLPADPNIFEMNFSEIMPIQNINLSGDFTVDQLKDYAEYLEDRIEDLPEISKAEIRGVDDKEVRISVDLQKMESLDISFNDIASAISNRNRSISGGNLLVDGYRRNIRVVGDFKEIEEIGNVIVKHEKGNIVYLRNISETTFKEVEKESYAREYRAPVVMIDVMKRGGENLIIVSEKIDKIIEEAKEDYFPENLDISVTNDQSNQTKTQLNELVNSIIFGVILVVLVLTFFLGLRNALFVGIAIPLSMLMSFLILNMMGITLNTIVLFSLVLALGMLVDNGIVVVENVYRLMDEGYSRWEAAKRGAGEVSYAIIASTATTLAAFVPLAMWPGLMGEFMKYLPLTLIIVLSSSLFVALIINPGLTARYMKTEESEPNKKKFSKISAVLIIVGVLIGYVAGVLWLGNLLIASGALILGQIWIGVKATELFQNRVLPWFETQYEKILRLALKGAFPYVFFFGTVGLLVFAIGLLGVFPPNTLFFPENQPNQAIVYIELPIGTDIEETNKLTLQLEERVLDVVNEYTYVQDTGTGPFEFNYMVESVIAQVGQGTSDPNAGPSMAQTPNKSKITVAFRPFGERIDEDGDLIQSQSVMARIQEYIGNAPGAQITVDKDAQGPPTGAPINIEVSGDDYLEIIQIADNIRGFINESGVQGIEELKLDVQQGKPELLVDIDYSKARTYGISTAQIGDALRTALYGKEISRYKEGEDDYPINLRYQDQYRYNIDDLLNQKITFRDQGSGKIKQIPISSVATPKKSSTFSVVSRIDLDRVITIKSNVLTGDGYNATSINDELKELLDDYELPRGVEISFTGEQEKQAEEMSFLSGALLTAVFLIFLILVAQFNSASTPFIILTTVVLSLIGVLLGLVIFRDDFVIMMTMIGIISLAGIVVNNAIVLIDFINLLIARKKEDLGLLRKDKLPFEYYSDIIIEAGKKRLRPVLLTAITTVLGLIPLAMGINIDFISLITNNDPQFFIGGDNVVFWGPMSWAIIYGLTFATFLTLVIVPVMFFLMNNIASKVFKS